MRKEKILVREDITEKDRTKYSLTPGMTYDEGTVFNDASRGKVVQVINDLHQVMQVPIECFEEEDRLRALPVPPLKNFPHTKHH